MTTITQQGTTLLQSNVPAHLLTNIFHPFSTDYLFSIILFQSMSLSFQKSSFCYLEQKHITESAEAQAGEKMNQDDFQTEEEEGEPVEEVIKTSREVRHYRSRTRTGQPFTIIINKVEKVERLQHNLRRFKGMLPSFTV